MFLNIGKHEKNSIAVIDDKGCMLTYGELEDAVESFYPQMTSRAVAFILSENCADSLVGYIGMIERDVVPMILNRKIDKELLHSLVETYRPKYIYMPEEDEEAFKDYGLAGLNTCSVYKYGNYELFETGYESYPINDKLQFLMTTSGSTGSPKLVRYKKGNLEANARNVAKAFGWDNTERAICDLGMQYTMGLNVINTHLYVGATVLLTSYNMIGSDYWDFIKEHKGTNFTGVPFSYDILHRLHFERMEAIESIRTFSQGGGKLTDERFKEFTEFCKRTGRRFIASFGTTETSARMCMLDPAMACDKIGSIGKAIPEGELFLIDSDGEKVEAEYGEGELCYKGPNVTMGYAVCKDDLNKDDEWYGEYHTGDLAKRDGDGYYYITGRMGRFLKLLGHRVGLDECERMISEKFGCGCACVGDDQKMKVFVDGEAESDDVIGFISEKLGLYKDLFEVSVVCAIPRNDRGKVDYKKLAE